jgi:hypothetical protein
MEHRHHLSRQCDSLPQQVNFSRELLHVVNMLMLTISLAQPLHKQNIVTDRKKNLTHTMDFCNELS